MLNRMNSLFSILIVQKNNSFANYKQKQEINMEATRKALSLSEREACFKWTSYTGSDVKWVWDMSQYNKQSDCQYAGFYILAAHLHVGLFLSGSIPSMAENPQWPETEAIIQCNIWMLGGTDWLVTWSITHINIPNIACPFRNSNYLFQWELYVISISRKSSNHLFLWIH